MILQGEKGVTLELGIDRYEFPEIINKRWDANWLMVRGAVQSGEGHWTFRDPCLTTFELERLVRWLNDVAEEPTDASECHFTEPNLAFAYLPSPRPAIQVRFLLESAPPWFTWRQRYPDGIALTFPLAVNDPRSMAKQVRGWLSEFPVRGPRDDGQMI